MSYRVAVVGATGAVGAKMIQLLCQREFPFSEIVGFATASTVQQRKHIDGIELRELTEENIKGFDIALFSAGAQISRQWANKFEFVIDNSTAWRMDENVPLIIPEINGDALSADAKIIANPNCVAITALVALAPLHRQFDLQNYVATSFQAASGAGYKGVDELLHQFDNLDFDKVEQLSLGDLAQFRNLPTEIHKHPLAFNVIPELGQIGEDGYTDEEQKMIDESRKVLNHPSLQVTPTCVRVPTLVGHGVQLLASFASPISVKEAERALQAAPGVSVVDTPTPLQAAGQDDVLVGRFRPAGDRQINIFAAGDNLRKGAALNAVQIAELWVDAA